MTQPAPLSQPSLKRLPDRVAPSSLRLSPFSELILSMYGATATVPRGPVMFTAVERGAGVSWSAASVAAELSAAGSSVLLADALVVAALADGPTAVSLCRSVGSGRAWVLGTKEAGRAMAGPTPRPAAVLAALAQAFGIVLLDAPALAGNELTLKLASLTGGVIMVARQGKTELQPFLQACKLLRSLGGNVLGCVFNDL